MSSDSKRAEFEIALEYDPAAAKKAKEDIEQLKKYFHDLGKQTAKIGQVRIQQPRTGAVGRAGVTPAEHELKALAKVTRADQKRREDYESWWGKQIKAQDDAAKREARRVEREATQHVKDSNALKAGEGMVAERLNKQHERSRKAAEQEVAKAKRKEVTNAEKQKALALKQQHATEQTMLKWEHQEQRKADQERRRRANQELAQANRERRKAEREAEQHYKKLERDKERALAKETRELAKQQRQRDRMRSQGLSEGASMARSGALRIGAGAIAAGTLGVQAHLAMSKGVGEIMTLRPGFDEAEAKAMIKNGMATYGGETTTTAKAIYDIASSGFGDDKAKTQEVFDAASKLAVGGVTDVATAADGLTSALNAWSADVKSGELKISDVTDMFFQAAKDGKTTIEQLSQNIGTVAPNAAAFGVSLPEVMAVFGEVTKSGVKTETAASGLRQMIKSIVNPTKQAKEAAAAMGIKVGSKAIEDAGGLNVWLEKMMTSKRYKDSRMQAIFSDMDGQSIVNALRALGPHGLTDAKRRQVQSTGATEDAFNTMMKTDHMRAQKIMGEVKVALVEFGEAIMPLVRDAMPHVTAGLQELRKWLEKEENRNLLISATKVALMLGGVAAVGGPLARLITTLNLLMAGSLASSASRLATGIGSAAGAMAPLSPALALLAAAVVAAQGSIERATKREEIEEKKQDEISNATTSSNDWQERDDLNKPLTSIKAVSAEHARQYDEVKKNRTLMSEAGDLAQMLFRPDAKIIRYVTGLEFGPTEMETMIETSRSLKKAMADEKMKSDAIKASVDYDIKPFAGYMLHEFGDEAFSSMSYREKATYAFQKKKELLEKHGQNVDIPSYLINGGQSMPFDHLRPTLASLPDPPEWQPLSTEDRAYTSADLPPVRVELVLKEEATRKLIDARIDVANRRSARALRGPSLVQP